MVLQFFVGLLGLSVAYGWPLEEYYVNGGDPYPNQQFYYNYQIQPRVSYFYPNDINKPEFHPELGMSPQYHDLVYKYVKDFAGTQPPPRADTVQPFLYNGGGPVQSATFGTGSGSNLNVANDQTGTKEVTDKPGLNDYFLPSDFLSLPNHPKSQFYGHLDAIKTKRIPPKGQPTSLPPIGGVISNYVLQRDQKPPQNLLQLFGAVRDKESILQHIKRQTPDNTDGVEILAEPLEGNKMAQEQKEEADSIKEEEQEQQMDAQPGIAQSKPSAIALAGPGGMAQASPVGTALVGQGGLAVAAPSGTAVAGPAGQGAIPIQIGGSEKQKKETTEKSEESDSY